MMEVKNKNAKPCRALRQQPVNRSGKRTFQMTAFISAAIIVLIGILWISIANIYDIQCEEDKSLMIDRSIGKSEEANKTRCVERAIKNKYKKNEFGNKHFNTEWKPYSNIKPPNVPDGEAWKPRRPKIHQIDYVTIGNTTTSPIHRNAAEQMLLDIFTCEVGDPPLPLGNLPQAERNKIVDLLVSSNPITDKDSEQVKVSKKILYDAKKEMANYLAKGGDPDVFFLHYHNMLLKAWEKRQIAQQMALDIVEKEGDGELARDFVRRINEELMADGIKKIAIDKRLLE